MALEQKLSLKLSQRLVMTPSLQQAIKLLQMTRMELEGVLNQELIENPILEDTKLESEEAEPEGESDEAQEEAADSMDDIDLDAYFNEYLDYRENPSSNTYEQGEAVPIENTLSHDPDLYDHLLWQIQMAELPTEIREVAELIVGNLDGEGFLVATIEEMQALGAETEELNAWRKALAAWTKAHDRWKAAHEAGVENEATGDSPADLAMPVAATDALPSRADAATGRAEGVAGEGRVGEGLEIEEPPQAAVVEATRAAAPASAGESGGDPEPEFDFEGLPEERPEPPGFSRRQVEEALAFVRTLDPPGIGYPDLRESLCAQLEARNEEDTLAYALVKDHWGRFLKRQYVAIAKDLGVPLEQLREPVEVVKTLETRPGRRYNNDRTEYVEPDVHVVKVGDEYVIQLNDDGMPRLRVSRAYRQMLRDMKRDKSQAEAHQYIKEKMRSAIWLIKSLDQRQRTIYKVAASIVKQQQAFLEKGIEHLRPMVLRDVAEDIEMHESTVSRVVSNKYIHTPRGLYPMKFFFHSGIDRDYGEDISSLTVKRHIQSFIDGEDPKKPLSDSEIMRRLNREGINIARRTVAKYRDELNIPSSTDRKKIF